jgi:ribosomal 30S subunit maturation factor RimM
MKNIYKLKLFESCIIFNNQNCTEVFKRVPGGWVWIITNSKGNTSCFVPFNNEFVKEENCWS